MNRRCLVFALLTALAGSLRAASPPVQPASGPGGADYPYRNTFVTETGRGTTQAWVFEPEERSRTALPLILFLHGWSAMEPWGYEDWLHHLARRGAVVVYPRYQTSLLTPPRDFLPNIQAALRDALASRAGKSAIDLHRVAAIGHSAGAVCAVNYAASASSAGLPSPSALVIVQPGQGPKDGIPLLGLENLGAIAAGTRLAVIVGTDDATVGEGTARRIWAQTGHLTERRFITMTSDRHGSPALRAGHIAPLASGPLSTNALDWFGFWRIADVTLRSAFQRKALHIEPSMGLWSDGHPVAPLRIEPFSTVKHH